MHRYTFNFKITPPVDVEYVVAVPPFQATLRQTIMALKVTAHATDEHRLQREAVQISDNLAAALSYELVQGFNVEYQGRHVVRDTGQQSISATFRVVVRPADFEAREAAQRAKWQVAQGRVVELAKREIIDPGLRDMLRHWSRYVADHEGRLNSLYDVLQVVERLYGGRKKAASILNMSDADLSELARISNNPSVLNGRHPGRSQGPHRIATETEVNTCERVARAIIERQAARIVA